MSALQASVTGMLAHQMRLDALGNNIANANTVGYKSERVLFTDAFYQLLEAASGPTEDLGGTNPSELGQGTAVMSIDTLFMQGTLLPTGRTTDIAIEGDGFLAVTDGLNFHYTRNGALGLDVNGHLVHLASGLRVVALPPSGGPGPSPSVTPASTLQIPIGESALAQATTGLTLGGNLDARAAAGDAHPLTARIYDSLGAGHDITLTFTRSAGGWDVTGTSSDGTITVAPPAQMTFDADGNATVTDLTMQMTLTNANVANATVDATISVAGITQLAEDGSAALRSQNGVPPGTLTGLTIDQDGSIHGVYSNGLSNDLGQIVTATFANTRVLANAGSSLFTETVNSGVPVFGAPGSDGRGAVRSGQLESSNVNLAQEFADMIVTQRGFQASSRVFSAADEMLQELLNVAG